VADREKGNGPEETGSVPVSLENEARANLACYFLRSILERSSAGKTADDLPRVFERGVRISAAGMTAWISGDEKGLTVSPRQKGKPAVSVEGDLRVLIRILLGAGVVVPFLKGDVRLGGNPLAALKVLSFLRIPGRTG
jgi:hypothetical protein